MMNHNGREPETLRDFLTYLPSYVNNDYNDIVSYIVWKTAKLCLTTDNEKIDWRSIVNLIESDHWKSDRYVHLLEGKNWREIDKVQNLDNLHKGTICNRQCLPAETVYYCFTCTTNPLYEICEFCFDASEHIGHTYTAKVVTRAEGRICNCGDPSVFNEPQFAFKCKNKLNNDNYNTDNHIKSNDKNDEHFDPVMFETFNDIIDYIIDVILDINELQNKSIFKGNKSYNNSNRDEVVENRRKTEFIQNKDSIFNEILIETTDMQDMIYEPFATNMNLDEWWTIQLNGEENQVHVMDLAIKISKILRKPIGYAISICNKITDDFVPVILVQSKDYNNIKKIYQEFKDENVIVHIKRLHDIFKIRLMEDLIYFFYTICTDRAASYKTKFTLRSSMLDSWKPRREYAESAYNQSLKTKINLFGGFLAPEQSASSSGSSDPALDDSKKPSWFNPWNFHNIEDTHVSNVMKEYDNDLTKAVLDSVKSNFCFFRGSRFQFLATEFTSHFSRITSLRMIKVFCTMFCLTDEIRLCLSAQYFDIYLPIVYNTVASDPIGLKLSFMSLVSQYTFQNPLIANLAIRSGFIERTLKFSFTLLAFNSEDLVAYLPIAFYNKFKLPSESIKNRKTIICFKDLCILMSTNTIPQQLLESHSIFNCMLDAFLQFSNILTVKRETSEHVEFENFDFSTYYFFFSSLLIMFDGYIRSISLITDKELRLNIVKDFMKVTVAKGFELLSFFRHPVEITSNVHDGHIPKLSAIKEKVCNHVTDVIRFQVGIDCQTFLNPTSYLFKSILQWSQCGRYNPVPKEVVEYVDFHKFFGDEVKALYISEASLSTLVLIGQINVGFWVKNGSPIIHQKKMYTKYNMREFTYMSDLFNVQFSMCMANPDDFMVTFLTRWGLKNWANGVPMGDYPDNETTVAIVNECLLLLIQLLTEVKSLIVTSSVESFERTLKSEIIHAVAFSHCSYAQIMESIPEHVTKHAAFDRYLEQYTTFTPASGLTDSGTFSLKKRCIEKIDPYYLGLSPSKRYEIEKSIRKHMSLTENKDFMDTFVPAKNIQTSLKSTPYYNLYSISSVNTFGFFLKNTLEHIKKYKYESVLPRVIHLIHLCVVNNLNDFMEIFWHEYAVVDTEFYHFHSIGSILYSLLLSDSFLNVHGKIREIFRVLAHRAPHIDVNSYLKEQTPSFNPKIIWSSEESKTNKEEQYAQKKKMALARREKILRKFSKQQLKFLAKNVTESSTTKQQYMEESTNVTEEDLNLGWAYPDDYCVFCKVDKSDDMFVYFSYQEMNICDHGIDFSSVNDVNNLLANALEKGNSCTTANDRMEFTEQAPVLRTCGHGSHIKCLADHMKSVSSVHTQTTKNIPISYGFGLVYCPVCNSLANSFLPKVGKYNTKSKDKFLISLPQNNNSLDLTPELVSNCKKACAIFVNLTGKNISQGNDGEIYKTISDILVNTIANLELRLRSPFSEKSLSNILLSNIPDQCIVTLRLLSDLLVFAGEYLDIKQISRDTARWYSPLFVGDYNHTLSLANSMFLSKEIHPNSSFDILDLVYSFMDNYLIGLFKELIRVNFFESASESQISWKNTHFYATDEIDLEKYYLMKNIMEMYLKFFNYENPVQRKIMNQIPKYVYHLLRKSLTVFLRRLVMLFHVHFSVECESRPIKKIPEETDFLLNHFNISDLTTFDQCLERFSISYLPKVKQVYDNTTINERILLFKKLDNRFIKSFTPAHLIRLPNSLSHFFSTPEYESNKIYRIFRGESAICLLCGKTLVIQKPVALHCYKIGECTNHLLNECDTESRYGLFLMIRTNMIYISYGERGTFYHSPYINKYREADQDLKFGTPVFLNEDRYNNLISEVFLGNMIPHLVFRLTEGNTDQGGWETL